MASSLLFSSLRTLEHSISRQDEFRLAAFSSTSASTLEGFLAFIGQKAISGSFLAARTDHVRHLSSLVSIVALLTTLSIALG